MSPVGTHTGVGRRRRRGAAAPSLNPPVNTGLPGITGTVQPGQTLNASTGAWTGASPITLAYQWKRNGAPISGATGTTYMLSVTDAGASITVTVTATNTDGSASATSAGVSFSSEANILSVNAESWSVQYSSPPTFDPVGDPKYLYVSRSGFDANGSAATYTEALTVTQRVRQAYPNQASLDASRCALSDYVYATDTILGAATNNATETSPKPIANWILPDHQIIGNSPDRKLFGLVAFHRNARSREQVACVEWRWSDGTNTVTMRNSTSEVAGYAGDLNPVVAYFPATNPDLSSLTNGNITVNAKVYPWIGGAASVLDSASSSVAREFSPRTFIKNPTLAASPVYVYVNASTGNDTTGAVSTTAATAEASPCLTIAGAINRAIAVNAALDGVVIRLMAGTHVLSTAAISTTRTQNGGELIVTRDPNTTRAAAIMQFGATAPRPRIGASGGYLKLTDITLSRQGTGAITGEAASPLRLWFDQCSFDAGSFNSALYSNADGMFTGVTFSNLAASLLNAGTREHRLFRGCTIPSSGAAIEGWLMLGCLITNPGGALTTGTRTASGSIVAFNRSTGVNSASAFWSVGASADVVGAALVQNVIEYIAGAAGRSIAVSPDSATGNNTHIVIHNNTLAGQYQAGRGNLFYDEGTTARTSKLQSCVGNIHVAVYHKGDVFVTNGARVGNWAYLYGVGCRSEYIQCMGNGLLGDTEAQAYAGLGSVPGTSNTTPNDPKFTSPAATTWNGTAYSAGAGGGTYTLQSTSPCKALLADPVLRFDFAGNARASANDATGAYA